MHRCLTLAVLAATLVAQDACAESGTPRLDLSIGTMQQRDAGSARDVQFTLSYPIKGGLSAELTAGRSGADLDQLVFNELIDNELDAGYSLVLDHRIGIGLRYDFAVDRPLQPFVRAGYMQYRGDFRAALAHVQRGEFGSFVTLEVVDRPIQESSWYLAAGARYELSDSWDLSAQVQYSPVSYYGLDATQTSVQVGVGYTF